VSQRGAHAYETRCPEAVVAFALNCRGESEPINEMLEITLMEDWSVRIERYDLLPAKRDRVAGQSDHETIAPFSRDEEPPNAQSIATTARTFKELFGI